MRRFLHTNVANQAIDENVAYLHQRTRRFVRTLPRTPSAASTLVSLDGQILQRQEQTPPTLNPGQLPRWRVSPSPWPF